MPLIRGRAEEADTPLPAMPRARDPHPDWPLRDFRYRTSHDFREDRSDERDDHRSVRKPARLCRIPGGVAVMRILRTGGRRSHGGESGYVLMNEHLLEYEGRHRSRVLCHLLVFLGEDKPPVCVVGNFDADFGTSTTNASEVVATAVSDRIEREAFRLIEWYPHWSQTQGRFSEVLLTPAPPTEIPYGQLVVGDGVDLHLKEHTVVVRYLNPRWTPHSEDELAELLGEGSIRELRSYAGLPGDYTPERLFASTGRQRASAVREHNRRVFDNLAAQLSEWT